MPLQAAYPHPVWTYDFMQDAAAGRKMRLLTIVDEFTRESLEIAVARRMPAQAVMAVLAGLFAERGAPTYLRSDNGPEFVAQSIKDWLACQGVKTHYIDPGSPWQNAYGESFNDKFRDECLNLEWFHSLAEARVIIQRWRQYYHEERPHSSLGYRTPAEFALAGKPNRRGLRPRTPRVSRFSGHRLGWGSRGSLLFFWR